MATKIRVKGIDSPVELNESIETVVRLLNEGPPDDWVIVTRADSNKLAVKPGDVTFVTEPKG
jgi:hypothetical protein